MPLAPLPSPPSRRPVDTGRPAELSTYSRRKTWCAEWEGEVWLWSTHGEWVLVASWRSSALPRMPSGPGSFCARVSTMKRWLGGTSSPVRAAPSGPRRTSGSSALSGTNTAVPLFTVWSTPWSKNWPKNVNSELYGGESPTSVVTFGVNSVWCVGTQFAGTPTTGGSARGCGSVVQGNLPGACWVRTGNEAAATAAGLVDVWSTTRLLTVRGWEST